MTNLIRPGGGGSAPSAPFTPCFRLRAAFLALCLGALAFSSCTRRSDWVHFRGEGGRGVSSARISPPLGVRWKIRLQPDSHEKIGALNPPVVIGDTIYFGSGDGNFYALDPESGYMRWVFKSGADINSIPYADSSQVYFGSRDGKLYALSRGTGEESWSFPTRSQINSQVERYGDHVIFVGDVDAFYFLSPEGEEEFRINNPGWSNYTFNIAEGVIYFATGPSVDLVGPYDIKTREFLWFLPYHEIQAGWWSFPAIREDLVYFSAADAYSGVMELSFRALNRLTGEPVWTERREGLFEGWDEERVWEFYMRSINCLDFMAPAIWRDAVIFTGGDRLARAFDAATGALRWERAFGSPTCSAPTIAGGRVYFGLLGDEERPPELVCLSARDGKLLWSMETEGSILSAPVIAGKRIIFGTDESVFYVLEEVF